MSDKKKECYITLTAILIWFSLFAAGLAVSSTPYLQSLEIRFSLAAFIITTLVYTPTNVALLSMSAGFIGGCISKLMGDEEINARLAEAHQANNENMIKNLERRRLYLTESPMLSLFRGFLTYIGVIAGILLLISTPFKEVSTEEYVRVAGSVSGLAFSMGYDPTSLRGDALKIFAVEANK